MIYAVAFLVVVGIFTIDAWTLRTLPMRRWWAEFRNPAMKCERLGHSLTHRDYSGFEKSNDRWCVAYDVAGTITYCSRCGVETARTVDYHYAIHSLTIDSDRDKIFMETGFVER